MIFEHLLTYFACENTMFSFFVSNQNLLSLAVLLTFTCKNPMKSFLVRNQTLLTVVYLTTNFTGERHIEGSKG